MLDQLCLPGCEGGPVFNQHGELVGVRIALFGRDPCDH